LTVLRSQDFENLLRFRTGLRRFLKFSEDAARAAGLTPAQHQLLLTVKGHPGNRPTVGEAADYLLLRHHSTVELVDRAEAAGLVRRQADDSDARVVRVTLTSLGEQRLAQLTYLHLGELRRLAPLLDHLVAGLDSGGVARP
jgi:DNA-binding MarR family transcriptional regulator